jgi:hypothetical protein
MGRLYRLAGGREVVGWECTNQFDLADALGFQLGLSVEALNSRASESGSCNH